MQPHAHFSGESPQDLYDLGLKADLAMLSQSPITRRRVLSLGLMGVAALLAGCAPIGTPTPPATHAEPGASEAGAAAECVSPIPRETAGPFPGNGAHGRRSTFSADPASFGPTSAPAWAPATRRKEFHCAWS